MLGRLDATAEEVHHVLAAPIIVTELADGSSHGGGECRQLSVVVPPATGLPA